jgi:hypothetical protein
MARIRVGPTRVPSRRMPQAAVEILLERGYAACEIDFEGGFGWITRGRRPSASSPTRPASPSPCTRPSPASWGIWSGTRSTGWRWGCSTTLPVSPPHAARSSWSSTPASCSGGSEKPRRGRSPNSSASCARDSRARGAQYPSASRSWVSSASSGRPKTCSGSPPAWTGSGPSSTSRTYTRSPTEDSSTRTRSPGYSKPPTTCSSRKHRSTSISPTSRQRIARSRV